MDEPVCGKTNGTKVCLKAPHVGRHKFSTRPHVAPVRKWEPIESICLETGLTRNPEEEIFVGGNVGVAGKHGDWTVIAIEQHAESGEVNVEVLKANGESHVYRLNRIRWRRQKRRVAA